MKFVWESMVPSVNISIVHIEFEKVLSQILSNTQRNKKHKLPVLLKIRILDYGQNTGSLIIRVSGMNSLIPRTVSVWYRVDGEKVLFTREDLKKEIKTAEIAKEILGKPKHSRLLSVAA